MINVFKSLVDPHERKLAEAKLLVKKINDLEKSISSLSDEELKQKTDFLKEELSHGKSLNDILPLAFALVRESITRTIGERAYDVQLIAAIILHLGGIAEQKTGEGKTHSVIFAAYLNALTGRGVHVVTPNDYLTKVGAGWYPKALLKLGVSTSAIAHESSYILDPDYTDPEQTVDERLSHLRPCTRQEAYAADITYGTNNEFGFDYLRDHMVSSFSEMVQRGHYYAIVDEVDFVLIDEARTPLIISSPDNRPPGKYIEYSNIVNQLQPTDYVIDEKSRSASLSEYGIRKVERTIGAKNLYEESFETIHYIENAIKAKALYHKDIHYVVKDGQIVIVDEFTGRLMPGRRWSDGLHQAVEAKEGVTVQQESKTWATVTFQNYFRMYDKLAGMTGTAATEAEEFRKIYKLEVYPIPTHRPTKRIDSPDLIYKTQRAKYAAIASRVEELHQKGQPVLIGTTSIEKNQIISSLLSKKKIPHQVLNAKNHQSEAATIASAGKKGAVTVATNMAGRGVDIILGGPKPEDRSLIDVWQKDHEEVIALGGLYVIGTERHESRRIDNQLRGRSGRQGDPGSSQFYVALDDDLMRIFGGDKIASLMTKFNMADDVPLTHPLVSRSLEQIQIKVEGYHFDSRKSVVEYDDVVNKQRQIIYKIRDEALFNAQNNPQKLEEDVLKIYTKQIEKLFILHTNPDSGTHDFEKISLEYNELLPAPESVRTKTKQQLETVEQPSAFLQEIIKKEWSSRKEAFGEIISCDMAKYAIISSLDPLWVDHLTALDDLRNGVRLRGYAQKDPLVEYRKEGFEMFQALVGQFEYNFVRTLFRLQPQFIQQPTAPPKAQEIRGPETDISPQNQPNLSSELPENLEDLTINVKRVTQAVSNHPELGRNDPCWCGSGKKYKKCHFPN